MSLLSYQGMIANATKPFSDPTSIFKNPAGSGLTDLSGASSALAVIEEGLAPVPAPLDPPFVSAVASASTALSSQITSHLTTKVAALPTEMSIMRGAEKSAANAMMVDAVATGDFSTAPDPIVTSFPGNACPQAYNTRTSDAFKTITDSSARLTTVNTTATSNLAALPDLPALMSAVGTAANTTITTVQGLMTTLAGATGAVRSAIVDAVRTTAASLPTLSSGLSSAVSSIQTDMSAVTNDFNGWVATETAAVSGAIAHLQAAYVVSLLNNKDTCVQSVMGAATNPSNVDVRTLHIADTLHNVEHPKQVAVNAVNSGSPIIAIETPSKDPVIAPPVDTDPNAYTSAELEAMHADWKSVGATTDSLRAAAATWWHDNFVVWKKSVNYEAVAASAGWQLKEQQWVTPNPATQAQIDAYTALRAQGIAKRDYYNNTLLPEIKASQALYDAKGREWALRFKYGKHPYTTMAAAGTVVPADAQTTYYDTTV